MSDNGDDKRARQAVAEAWDEYWKSHQGELEGSSPPFIVKALHGALGPLKGKFVLEAGSGTGGLSRTLALAGARVCLLDMVPQCVKIGLREAGMIGAVGDLFHAPFASDTFDCVFNHGVMEHFSPENVKRGIAEMARVLKPGGRLVVMVPSARGKFYTAGKRRLERAGLWEYGIEHPQPSLAKVGEALGLRPTGESWTGVRHQVNFLRGWRHRIARLMVRPFEEDSKLGIALFGAYLLVSCWEKPLPVAVGSAS